MGFYIWDARLFADNAAAHRDEGYRDRAAWEIHRHSARKEIVQTMGDVVIDLRAPELPPWFEQRFESRAEFEERMNQILDILRLALKHKEREESDPRFALLYDALGKARDAVYEALTTGIHKEGVNVNLDALVSAVAEAVRIQKEE